MTRFARAKGSKASNKRELEAATPWQDMKTNLVEKKAKKESINTQQETSTEKPDNKDYTSEVNKCKKEFKRKSEPPHNKFDKKKKLIDNTLQTGNNKKSEEYKRRKPFNEPPKTFINGAEVQLAYFDGFPIRKSDCVRLKQLKKEMISRGIPRSEVAKALKLERRKAEKSLTREKKKVCFNCRRSGHTLSECPSLNSGPDAQLSETGICFKCGSTEHTHYECKVTRGDHFKFAQCFICKEQGHISRQCPDNSKGLYPKGGACKMCGDVTHLKKDCPKYQVEQEETKIVAHTINEDAIEALEDQRAGHVQQPKKRLNKVVKF